MCLSKSTFHKQKYQYYINICFFFLNTFLYIQLIFAIDFSIKDNYKILQKTKFVKIIIQF